MSQTLIPQFGILTQEPLWRPTTEDIELSAISHYHHCITTLVKYVMDTIFPHTIPTSLVSSFL